MRGRIEADAQDAHDSRPVSTRIKNASVFIVLFAAVMALVYWYFFAYHKTNVWSVDGINAHFPALNYVNLWFRRIVYHPEAGIPLWSWDLGLGADIIPTLAFPALGDPFALISLLFPMRYLEYAYGVMFLARIVCAGGFSALYFRKMGASYVGAFSGALIYTFSTFTLVSALRHPLFANALVFLPLLLLGIERRLRDGRWLLLTVSVALAAIGNFYFFYMHAIITVIYAVARYLEVTPRADRWRQIARQAARVAGPYVLGVMLAAPLLVPTILGFFASSRGGGASVINLVYSVRDYIDNLAALTAPLVAHDSTFLGYGFVGVLLIPVLFLRRTSNTALKAMLIVFAVFVSLPIFGSVFNGFSFPSNRFVFSAGMFVGLTAALILSDGQPFSRRELKVTLYWFVGYCGAVVLLKPSLTPASVFPMLIGALTWGVLAFEARSAGSDAPDGEVPLRGIPGTEWRASSTRWVIAGLLILNIAGNAAMLYHVGYGNLLAEYQDWGSVGAYYREDPGMAARPFAKEVAYRIEDAGSLTNNDALVQKHHGTSFYYSIMNRHLAEYKAELDSRTGWSSFAYNGFDDRAALTTLVGVKYYFATKDERKQAPYGFVKERAVGPVTVYRNAHALPIGFVYDAVIDRSVYEGMTPLDRQQAMLVGAVVEDAGGLGLPSITPTSEVIDVPYTVESTKGVTADLMGGRFEKTSEKSRIVLRVAAMPEAELYVELKEFDDVVQSPLERRDTLGTDLSRLEEIALVRRSRAFNPPQDISTTYSSGGVSKTETWLTTESPYYWGNRSQLVNLGYKRAGEQTITIDMTRVGTVTFEELGVYAVPMSGYAERVNHLAGAAMTNIEIGSNSMRGRVNTQGDGLLFLSIPYSTGWTAEVDGYPVEIMRTNTAFCGVPIEAGRHEVKLNYATPGLRAGIALGASALAIIVALLGMAWYRGRRTPAPAGKRR